MTFVKKIIILLFIVLFGRIGGLSEAFAEELMTLPEALRAIFPQASQIVPDTLRLTKEQIEKIETQAQIGRDFFLEQGYNVHVAQNDSAEPLGYAFEDTVKGKWGPIHYLVGIDPAGKVIKVIVLSYQERRGRPTAKPRFLKQFIDKTVKDPLQLRKDINGISGATVSSQAITDGVRKLLFIFEEFYENSSNQR